MTGEQLGYREDGAEYLTLRPGEALAAVVLPPAGARRTGYAKARVRDAVDFPLAGVAASLHRNGDVIGELKMAITGTNSAPLMIPNELGGRPWDDEAAASLALTLQSAANVLRTTVTAPKYRRRVLQNIARRLVDTLWNEATSG